MDFVRKLKSEGTQQLLDPKFYDGGETVRRVSPAQLI